MANCGITSGISVSCDDLKRVSGVFKEAWAFNINDLRVPIDDISDAYVTALEFNSYRGLYKFESAKNSHQGTSELSRSDGGNVAFNQTAVLRVFNNDPTDDAVIEDLTTADVGIIFRTKNNEFLLYGAGSGLTATAFTQTTGRNLGEDTTATITLSGSEKKIFKRILRVDVTTTLAYLNALTV